MTSITVPESRNRDIAVRCVTGTSALVAILLFAKTVTMVLSPGHFLGDTLAPAGIAGLLVGLIIIVHVIRVDRA